jgi:CRP-like cAMP-binding protein
MDALERVMIETLFAKENIVHLAAALYLVGFLFRDQILLRAFVIAGDLVYISYFYFAPEVPLWGGVFWSAVFMVVNAVMIARILADRTSFRMSDEERQLFRFLETLTPGEFRQLIKVGRWQTAPEATVLAEENRSLENLYYVLAGGITIEKSGSAPRCIGPRAFIGEVAFLLPQPASATVTVAAGARYVTWNYAALRRQQLRAPSLAIALSAALNKDMAAKVARS